ncbi:ATP-binding protein [Vibrio sp. TRT 1302]|uniref:ATP-binding protein n=1 Tax=Vibrio sp. TRT 1302 TaxID=3418504 RepID=UPI003CE93AE9
MKICKTIGSRLVVAFTFTTLLLTFVCVLAWVTWYRLDQQVSSLLDTSVPKYNTSYMLESRSSEIRSRVQLLSTSNNKIELNRQRNELDKLLNSIKLKLSNFQPLKLEKNDSDELLSLYTQLEKTLEQYTRFVFDRVQQRRKVAKLSEQINWLHQDIHAELVSFRQEFYWQLTRGDSSEKHKATLEQLRVIQSVLDLESNIFVLTTESLQARNLEQIKNASTVIQFNIAELIATSEPLLILPSGISYQQLLDELQVLYVSDGVFSLLLSEGVILNARITEIKSEIEKLLGAIHQQIGQIIKYADTSFIDVKTRTANLVSDGNIVLLVCFGISILLSLFVTYYFINRRVVARLNALSSSIDAIIKGDFSHRIVVDGADEIGQLSQKLIDYGASVEELQRTNAVGLINNTSASLLTCDLAGYVESANFSAQKLLAMQGTVEHKLLWQSFRNQDRKRLAKVFVSGQALFTTGKDALTLPLDGETACYLHFDFHLFSHGQLHKVIVTITDVTQQELTAIELQKMVNDRTADLVEKNRLLSEEIVEREKAELTLKQAQDELIQAAKMAVVGQTMTCLAHELNQPLNAISTYLYSAQLSTDSGNLTSTRRSIEQVAQLSARMSEIIKSLRTFAKKSDTDQITDNLLLTDIVMQAIAIVGPKAKRQATNICNLLTEPLYVHGNALALEQVMVNILVNGCDAIAESNRHRQEIRIEKLFSNTSHHVIAISDSGCGFKPFIIDKLFTPFTTTKEVGLGLGLNISRALVEKYSGRIYLASRLDKGALVVLELSHARV